MSKKKKKKFKAQLDQQLHQFQKQNTNTIQQEEKQNKDFNKKDLVKDKNYNFIKKDIKKITIATIICIVIVIVVWVLNKQTNYIQNFANKLAEFSHIKN